MSKVDALHKAEVQRIGIKDVEEVRNEQVAYLRKTVREEGTISHKALRAIEEGNAQSVKHIIGKVIGNRDIYVKQDLVDIIHLFEPPCDPSKCNCQPA